MKQQETMTTQQKAATVENAVKFMFNGFSHIESIRIFGLNMGNHIAMKWELHKRDFGRFWCDLDELNKCMLIEFIERRIFFDQKEYELREKFSLLLKRKGLVYINVCLSIESNRKIIVLKYYDLGVNYEKFNNTEYEETSVLLLNNNVYWDRSFLEKYGISCANAEIEMCEGKEYLRL